MIIRRYFAREVYSTMVGVTLVLVFVFLVNQIIHWLDKAAVGKLAAGLLFHLIALEIPYLVGLLLPLGLYIGILVSYSRFYAENEMTVLFASGMSRWRLTQITLLISAAVFLIVLVLMLWVNPLIAARKNTVISSSSSNSVLATILPGRFQAAPSGRQVFYIDHVDKDRFRAKDIFVAQQPGEDSHWIIVSAKTGDQYIDPKTHDLFIVAKNGYRYQGIPGHKDFQVVKFDQYGVKVASLAREYKATAKDDQALSTWEIIQGMGEKIDYLAEFEWRLSLPVSVILLSILAMLPVVILFMPILFLFRKIW
ncbi:MAG: LPS export ABC transporter permease LptF [Gammaproteobacteria bacterium]